VTTEQTHEETEINEPVEAVVPEEKSEIADESERPPSPEMDTVEDLTEKSVEEEEMDVDRDEEKGMEVEEITDKDDVIDITDKDDVIEVPVNSTGDKDEIVAEEKKSRVSRWGTRWTKEAPDVKIGEMITAPVVAPVPVPKTDTEGNKLTKSQRKKLKKKRRKETKRTSVDDSGIETGNDSDHQVNKKSGNKESEKNLKIDIDYIAEEPELNPATLQFKKVFDAFRAAQFMTDETGRAKSGEPF